VKLNNGLVNTASLISNGAISGIILLFFMNYFKDLDWELRFVLTLLSVLTMVILVLSYKQFLLFGLSFAIPLSVPFSINGSSISLPAELICVFLSGFLLVKIILGTRPEPAFLKHPITLLILADLGWILFSSIFSQMPEASFKRLIIRSCYYITFYYFYAELFRQDPGNIKRLFTVHVIGFLFPIIYAMINHAMLGFETVGSQQISAPFYFDHTIYGACLVFFIPFLLHYSFREASPSKEKNGYRVLLAVFIIATLLSYSRAAWLSGIIALTVAFCLKYKIRFNYLAALAVILVAALAMNQQRIATFFKENKETSHSNDVSMHFKSISNVNTDASNKERINRWKCALRMFADKPLTGFGPGTYQFFYGQYQRREDMTRISTYNGTKGHAHSEYLNYLSETGLIGCLIFVTLIVTVIIKGRYLVLKSKYEETRHVALYLLAGLITFFIHAFFNGFLEFDKMAMPVFASYAAITSLNLREQSS
jgi:putative inorganic carbon (HCO3(-)) transporter